MAYMHGNPHDEIFVGTEYADSDMMDPLLLSPESGSTSPFSCSEQSPSLPVPLDDTLNAQGTFLLVTLSCQS